MRSVLYMAVANIRKKKVQNLLIIVTILISAMLFSSAVGSLMSLNTPVANMYANQKISHDIVLFDSKVCDAAKIVEWWKGQEGTGLTALMPFFDVKGSVMLKGKKTDLGEIYLTEKPEGESQQDMLKIVEGDKKANPSKGEIWITTGFAYAKEIKVGDVLGIPTEIGVQNLTVSAVVVDPQFSAKVMNPTRLWVAGGEIRRMFPGEWSGEYMLGIRYRAEKEVEKIWTEFEKFLKGPFPGERWHYDTILLIYTILQKAVGLVLFGLAILFALMSIAIISFIISNAVLNDYKVIGILKSQGFSPANINCMYSGQYVLLSLIAVPLGIIMSNFVIRMLLKDLIKAIGITSLEYSMLIPAVVTFLTFIIVIAVSSFLSSLKAGQVKPSYAIRFEEPPKKHKKTVAGGNMLKALPLPLFLGVKQIFSNWRQSVFIFTISIVMAFVFVFAVNLNNTFKQLKNNLEYFGYDKRQVTVTRTVGKEMVAHEDLWKYLTEDKKVKAAVSYDVITDFAIAEQDGRPPKNIIGYVYEGNMDGVGITNLEGRNPSKGNEIAVSASAANSYQKKVGDSIEVYVKGKKTTFLITGIFQSNSGIGWTLRMQMSAVKKVFPAYEPKRYALTLMEGQKPEDYVNAFKNVYRDRADIELGNKEAEIAAHDATFGMGAGLVLLAAIFTAVIFIIIFNLVSMDINRQKKNLGILKTFGMTQTEIRLSIAYRVMILTLWGLVAGIPLSLALSPGILNSLLANIGIVRFPFNVTVAGTFLLVPLCLLITGASAWVPSRKILGISPRSLVVE